ncbi:LysR substrate-binding domain-containing protein [Streptomyces sp. NPDC059161]|uniref:LysR substrate-binding domain-containing protein n=1 Tax=Streptomyces sp. NPDC059161 TaxID=3346749 RepID=UPI0036800E4C
MCGFRAVTRPMEFVAAGLCVALMPQLALPRASPDIVARPLAAPQLTRFIYAVRIDTRHAPRAVLDLERILAAQALAALS